MYYFFIILLLFKMYLGYLKDSLVSYFNFAVQLK